MVVAPAVAQAPPPGEASGPGQPAPVTAKLGDWTFGIWARSDYTFLTDIDGGGSFTNTSADFVFSAETLIQRDLQLRLSLSGGADFYDFKGVTSFGGFDPWDAVYSVGVKARVNWSVTNEWVIFSGADILFWREAAAGWDNAITGGGLVGATYVFGQDLQLGLGFFIGSKLEDNVLFVPVPVIHWQIDEHWRISTQERAGLTGGTGAEVIYDFGGGWAAALGIRYDFKRFRLSDSGPFPDGVGQDTSYPMWGRLTWQANKNFALDMYGGFFVGGTFEVADSAGFKLGESDYDGAPFVGLSLRFEY